MNLERCDKEIQALGKELANSFAQKQLVSISRITGHSNMTRSGKYKDKTHSLHLSNFNKVLKIDPDARSVLVQPGISMAELVKATLPYGLIPKVVPEFKGITVGGAVMGAAIESSSHHQGQFNDTCSAFEILLGDGTLIQATREQNSDLFYGISGSYGSLGFLSKVEIELIPASESITLTYTHYSNIGDLLEGLRKSINQQFPPEYLEGIVFNEEQGIAIEGRPSTPSEITSLEKVTTEGLWDPWFVKHAKQLKGNTCQECMPIFDYLFRYDKGAFWMGCYVLQPQFLWRHLLKKQLRNLHESQRKLPPFPEDLLSASLLPRLLGPLMNSQRLYSSLHAAPESWFAHYFVVQDFYIPETRVKDFIESAVQKTEIFPLWLCPVKGTLTPQFLAPHYCSGDSDCLPKQFINVGIYGVPKKCSAREATADLENLARSLGGRKMLYSQSYYSPEVFWEIYPKTDYSQLRKQYHAEGIFLPLDEKVLSHF